MHSVFVAPLLTNRTVFTYGNTVDTAGTTLWNKGEFFTPTDFRPVWVGTSLLVLHTRRGLIPRFFHSVCGYVAVIAPGVILCLSPFSTRFMAFVTKFIKKKGTRR